MKPDVVLDAPEALARAFADLFTVEAHAAVATRGRFSCALPGGSVAETFFPALAPAPVEWDKVEFFWGDERAVPPEDPDSNYGLAKRLLLDRVKALPGRIHRTTGEEGDLDAAARSCEEQLVRTLGKPPRLDVVLLGLGPDGHVCSLFPGHPLLSERNRLVAPILDSPKPPPERITFTLPLLEQARTLCVAGFGSSKAEAIRAAVEDPASRIPVALAVRGASRAVIFVDAAAAARLARPAGRG